METIYSFNEIRWILCGIHATIHVACVQKPVEKHLIPYMCGRDAINKDGACLEKSGPTGFELFIASDVRFYAL